jgi:hypothetical protein
LIYDKCESAQSLSGLQWRFQIARLPLAEEHRLERLQGINVGGALAFTTSQILMHAYVTKVDGWTTMYGCGEPDNGLLFRTACAQTFSGPINIRQEAVYWTTKADSLRFGGSPWAMRGITFCAKSDQPVQRQRPSRAPFTLREVAIS